MTRIKNFIVAGLLVFGVDAAVGQNDRMEAYTPARKLNKANLASTLTVIGQKEYAFTRIPLNEIKPTGALLDRLRVDLNGFVGHLDALVPDLIVKDDIYGKDRLTKKHRSKNLGNSPEGAEWEVQYLWWNSETQSNWWDGYIRNAFFAGDKTHIEKIKKYVAKILSTQDEDGYLGIYDEDLRYKFDTANGENGELWSKATLYRGLIAYYEFTGDTNVFEAVRRGVDNVMENYRINASHPFGVKKSSAGLCHGLVFTDILDWLYQQTGKSTYLDYALFLYKDYSSHELSEPDIQLYNILYLKDDLKGHGVHTYEHIRPLLLACYASDSPELKAALQIYLDKIKEVTTVTGGAVGDEWIFGRKADMTNTGYEYCSLHELLDSYTEIVKKTGDVRYADDIENTFFNAAAGARHPKKSAIAYCKTDNSYQMTGGLNFSFAPNHKQTRYKYSPAHQDVAVCCVPNAGRITPYYIQNMWLRDKDGFVALLFGGCELNTIFDNKKISIKETTDYPATSKITFDISVATPVSFALKIRKPSWMKEFIINSAYKETENYIILEKKWAGDTSIVIEWLPEIKKHLVNDEVYFTCNGQVLSLPIAAAEIPQRTYIEGFQDFEYIPQNFTLFEYAGEMPVLENGRFFANLYNSVWQKVEKKELKPIGQTVLRQTTFKIK
ncbi:MAG: glycoside hydrolase family 127 protein [Bacteroidales bacterium]|jgi:DUF1680 family protein|nr:glycoside hydrolase family 127 protein [Bacteroidales bacterium]